MSKIFHQSDEVTPFRRSNPDQTHPIRHADRRRRRRRLIYEEFLGMTAVVASPVMRRLVTITSRAARTNSPVLISGESGTGKELIARAVHHFSQRAGRPFVDVNCAAFPEHLMESELFGYERGAFSGAESSEAGLVRSGAHGNPLSG